MKRFFVLLFACFLSSFLEASIPEGYYLRADGKKGAELKAAMDNIISTVTKVLSYGSGAGKTWSGFYTTDRFNGNQVRDRYSNKQFYFSNSDSENSASAVDGMNIEHSFPKSWWGGTSNQAYKDLFNLMPCEQKINSSKSNYAMGVVTKVKTDNGCTKVGTGKAGSKDASLWEPADQWKGDFARNYFYMVTAYSEFTWEGEALKMLENNDWPTLQAWAQQLLLKWNREDPVDDIERERNEAVYAIQGNRNPYIDFPNLAEYVWGDSVDYAFHVQGLPALPDLDDEEEYEELEDTIELMAIDFTKTSMGWEVNNVQKPNGLNSVWTINSSYGEVASGRLNKQNVETEAWLVSPVIDLSEMAEATISFAHTGKFFGDMTQEATLWVTTDEGENWEQLPINHYMNGNDWTFVTNVTDLSAYCGEYVIIGFRYLSSTDHAPQWEIKTLSVEGIKRPALLAGDLDGDGILTSADVLLLSGLLLGDGDSTLDRSMADVNHDGEITIEDVTYLISLLK